MTHNIAQLNVARMRAPLDDPLMAEFVAALDAVNSLADKSPGFVWRLQDDSGAATSIRAFDDEKMLVNLSVWRSIEELKSFVYDTGHVEFLRQKKKWFDPQKSAHLVLWWIDGGHLPDMEEAAARLDLLRSRGPTGEAFTFSSPFPIPTDG